MEMQGFVNAMIGVMMTIILALIGIIYASIKGRTDKNEQEISAVKERMHEIDKVVSGEYIKREEVKDELEKIDIKLEKIYTALNNRG